MSHLRTVPIATRTDGQIIRGTSLRTNVTQVNGYQDLRRQTYLPEDGSYEARQRRSTADTEHDIGDYDQEHYPMSGNTRAEVYSDPTQQSHEVIVPHDEANSDQNVTAQTTETITCGLRPIGSPVGYPDLKWLPLFLRPWVNMTCFGMYAVSVAALLVLLFGTGNKNQFYTENENMYLAFRYGPSIVGTITSLLFKTTTREFFRICRYAVMADTKKGAPTYASAHRSVLARYFPLPNTGLRLSVPFCVLIAQWLSGFVVASKAALFTLERNNVGWTITAHFIPACFLILSHSTMLACTVLILFWLRKHPSGLIWDPAALADQVALFTQTGAIRDAASFESKRDSPQSIEARYRLGYWVDVTDDGDRKILYGIGDLVHAPERNSESQRSQSHTHQGLDRVERDHYPYKYMPFVGSIEITVWSVLVTISLGLLVSSICLGHYNSGFSVNNNIFPSVNETVRNGTYRSFNRTSTFTNQTIKHDDRIYNVGTIGLSQQNNIWIWAFLFRFLPTFFASTFATGFLFALDCNHRFVQPFLAMRQPNGGTPDDTILCTYNTDSSLELPGKAIAAGHYKVAWHSILFCVSPLFPISVASLYTIVNTGERVYFTYSQFSLNMTITYLVVYAATLAMPWPSPHRLMPRMNYNIMETVAMCHASSFAASSEMLDNSSPNATQSYMYDRIRLRAHNIQDRYVFGQYRGTDGRLHIGFDIAEKAGRSTGTVEHIPVEKSRKRWLGPLRRRKTKDEEDVGHEMSTWTGSMPGQTHHTSSEE